MDVLTISLCTFVYLMGAYFTAFIYSNFFNANTQVFRYFQHVDNEIEPYFIVVSVFWPICLPFLGLVIISKLEPGWIGRAYNKFIESRRPGWLN